MALEWGCLVVLGRCSCAEWSALVWSSWLALPAVILRLSLAWLKLEVFPRKRRLMLAQ